MSPLTAPAITALVAKILPIITVSCPTLMPGMEGKWVMQSNGNTAEGETAQSLIPGSEDMTSIEVNVEGIDKIIFVWQ